MSGVSQFLADYGPMALFVAVFSEQAGLPLPSAPWLLAAGALAASGRLSPVLALALVTLACVIADSIWFFLGRLRGNRMLSFLCRVSLASGKCRGRTEGLFMRHGMVGLMAAKFLPGLGAIMPPLAGVFRVSPVRFLFFDALGSIFYGTFYILIGYIFKDQVQQVLAVLGRLGFGAVGLALGTALGYIGLRLLRQRRNPLESAGAGTSVPTLSIPTPEPVSAKFEEDLVPSAGLHTCMSGKT